MTTISEGSESNSTLRTPVQVLTFIVGGEKYGVDILRVQEIRYWSAPTLLPNTPTYIKGLINIRGNAIVIADLRERLELPAGPAGSGNVIVVLRIRLGGSERAMGIIVDAVSEVTTIPQSTIKALPVLGLAGPRPLVTRIAALQDKLISILDIDRVFEACATC